MGYDEDVNQAMKIAVQQTVGWLASQQIVPMSREEAYALTSMVGDCRVSQVVDIRKGVHCMIPKNVFVKKECWGRSPGRPSPAPRAARICATWSPPSAAIASASTASPIPART